MIALASAWLKTVRALFRFPVIDRIITFNRLPVGDEATYLNPSAHLLRLSKTEELFTITESLDCYSIEIWTLPS